MLQALIRLIERSTNRLPDVTTSLESLEDVGYQAAYSKLVHTEKKPYDHLLQVAPDLHGHVALRLNALIQSYPQETNALINAGDWDEIDKQKLQAYIQPGMGSV